jgi:hypothetical protein
LSRPLDRTLINLTLIALTGLVVYSNTFNVPFLWDGVGKIAENPLIKDLGYFQNPIEAKGSRHYEFFRRRYIGYLSFALNYRINGASVFGYHLVNLIIHVADAFLVYALVVLTFRTPRLQGSPLQARARLIALLSGLFFISHPIQTQAVTYIIQRLTSLAALFYLLSLVAYVKARVSSRKAPGILLYALCLISAAMAMKTKESAFTLPFIVALYEFMFFRDSLKRRLPYLAPLALLIPIIPLGMIQPDAPMGQVVSGLAEETRLQTDMPRLHYLFTQFRVVVTYIRLLFLPVCQNIDYDYPVCRSLLRAGVLASFFFLAALFSLGMFLLARSRVSGSALRLPAFGIFWFFITLSVESGIVPIVDVIYEHRVYLPGVGAFLAVLSGGFLLMDKFADEKTGKAAAYLLILAVLVFSCAAYARNSLWKSEISLWGDAAKKSPFKVRPHNNLGLAYSEAGLIDEAIIHYGHALALKPDTLQVLNNMGLAYSKKTLFDKAINYYRIALSLDPDSIAVLNNMGLAYLRKGLLDEAEGYFVRARRLDLIKRPARRDYPDKFEYHHGSRKPGG